VRGDRPWLLLFGVGDTLICRAKTPGHLEVVAEVTVEMFGGGPALGSLAGMRTAGMTELRIARELLGRAGVPVGPELDREAGMFCGEVSRRYAARCPDDLTAAAIPGIPGVLAELEARPDVVLGLVTGCARGVAETKLAAAGLGRYFPSSIGGFGDDAEDRQLLVPLARARAGRKHGSEWPRERTVVIGDTPSDVVCARADGVRCVAVAFGDYTEADLTAVHPQRVACDAGQLLTAIELETIREGAARCTL